MFLRVTTVAMLSRVGCFSFNQSSSPFEDQFKLLKKFRFSPQRGVCALLTNAWLRERLAGRNPLFLQDDRETMKVVLKQSELHRVLYEAGERNLENSAFKLQDIPTEKHSLPFVKIKEFEDFEKLFGKSQTLMTIQFPSSIAPHVIGFEKEAQNSSKSRCRIFDANFPGGEVCGPCKVIHEILTTTVKHNITRSGKENPDIIITVAKRNLENTNERQSALQSLGRGL